MSIRWLWFWRRLRQSLSVRAGLFCVGALGTSLFAVKFSTYVPDRLADLLGGDAVDRILTILASSMLAVVTFSLSTLIASYAVAGASAPSRATSLIMRNTSAQTALSTFLGAFIFSVVSLVALSTQYYGPKGRVILFLMTILVLGAVIWTVIRWIGQLSGLGQLGNVIAEIENAVEKAIANQSTCILQNSAQLPPVDLRTEKVCSQATGFIQAIDFSSLSELVDECGIEVWLNVHPGQFVCPGRLIASVSTERLKHSSEVLQRIQSHFLIGARRTFEDDPRFGLVVLSEIASRALSQAINDPGTAIEIVGSQLRLLSKIHTLYSKPQPPWWSENLHLLPITAQDLIDDAFQALSRDGASIIEVGIFMQKALSSLSSYPEYGDAAHDRGRRSLEQGINALRSQYDIDRLNRSASWLR